MATDNGTALATREHAGPVDIAAIDLSAIERVIVVGDLSKLSPDERWDYYKGVCQSVGLNPFTKPFEYILLNGKLTLYALKGATDQLRGRYGISIGKPAVDITDGLCMVTVSATGRDGRTDSDLGIVTIDNLRGDARANAIMKAITKAKRRVTLSFCGLGMLDESEMDTIPSARTANVETIPARALPAPADDDDIDAKLDAATRKNLGREPKPDANPGPPPPADTETRAKFDAKWKRGVERAKAAGIKPDDAPPATATLVALNTAQREFLEAITNREKLNAEFLAKHAQVKAAGGDIADLDPTQETDAGVFEMLATLNELLDAAPDPEAL